MDGPLTVEPPRGKEYSASLANVGRLQDLMIFEYASSSLRGKRLARMTAACIS